MFMRKQAFISEGQEVYSCLRENRLHQYFYIIRRIKGKKNKRKPGRIKGIWYYLGTTTKRIRPRFVTIGKLEPQLPLYSKKLDKYLTFP